MNETEGDRVLVDNCLEDRLMKQILEFHYIIFFISYIMGLEILHRIKCKEDQRYDKVTEFIAYRRTIYSTLIKRKFIKGNENV